jgi:hypothetical protein
MINWLCGNDRLSVLAAQGQPPLGQIPQGKAMSRVQRLQPRPVMLVAAPDKQDGK